jgi:hypothetical protein
MWSILFGVVVGAVVGAKYNAKILPYVAAAEAMVQTWIKGVKGSGPT